MSDVNKKDTQEQRSFLRVPKWFRLPQWQKDITFMGWMMFLLICGFGLLAILQVLTRQQVMDHEARIQRNSQSKVVMNDRIHNEALKEVETWIASQTSIATIAGKDMKVSRWELAVVAVFTKEDLNSLLTRLERKARLLDLLPEDAQRLAPSDIETIRMVGWCDEDWAATWEPHALLEQRDFLAEDGTFQETVWVAQKVPMRVPRACYANVVMRARMSPLLEVWAMSAGFKHQVLPMQVERSYGRYGKITKEEAQENRNVRPMYVTGKVFHIYHDGRKPEHGEISHFIPVIRMGAFMWHILPGKLSERANNKRAL